MALSYSSTLKTARMQLVADLICGKTAAASTGSATTGTLEIQTSGGSALATFTVATTTTSGVSGSVLTLAFSAGTVTASGTGTAAKAQIKNNGGTVIVDSLTVGTSGSDINLNSVSITSGGNVTLSSGTITHG